MVALDAETTPGAAALRLPLAFAAALAAAPLVADEAGTPIPPEEWRAMTRGKTVWYALDGAHWGREYFHPDSDVATFLGRDGQCLSAPWAHVDGVYCFAHMAGCTASATAPRRGDRGDPRRRRRR